MQQQPNAADPHTYHQPGQPVPLHLKALVRVEFDKQELFIIEQIEFDRPGEVCLDSRDQKIVGVLGSATSPIAYACSDPDPMLGRCVTLTVPEDRIVHITFHVGSGAAGLQWLTPAQAGGATAVLYSQFEAINGRSVFIMPDSPGIRFTYDIELQVPTDFRGLGSANERIKTHVDGERRIDRLKMNVPVPLYQVSLNAGDFKYSAFDERSGVWVSPDGLMRAHTALARTPEVLAAAERLFGPYLWGRYGTIVLPQRGYPYGAMEHPCLTSMNAMLLADDYAATRVTIHELMHSWFGNLITNATWEDFWLNEGVTTFAEWLVIGELLGEDAMYLQIARGMKDLENAFDQFEQRGLPEMTRLKTSLRGLNPDDYFSRVPYMKGALFLWAIMERVGRERMLATLGAYIGAYRFTAIDTEEFLRFLARELGQEVLDAVDAQAWVYAPGLPATAPVIESSVEAEVLGYASEAAHPADSVAQGWKAEHWSLYLASLDRRKTTDGLLAALGKYPGFSAPDNGMLEFELLRAALEAPRCVPEVYLDRLEAFLLSYGRTVYLRPLYRALCKRGYTEDARSIYQKARPGYHPAGRETVEAVLRECGAEVSYA